MPAVAHIVVVDDDLPVRRALARLLKAAGFEVSSCGSAEEFLVQSHDLKPACLLLDVHLPRISGLELARLLARLAQPVPIIFITADHEVAHSAEMQHAGWPCLVKPIDDEALLAMISATTRAG